MIILKVLFENTTKYTKQTYETFLAFHRKKYRFSYIAYNVITIALILFCLTFQVAYHNLSIAILFCCILTGFILWRYLHPISELSKEYKSDKIKNEKSFTFKFYNDFMTCEDKRQISKMKYSKFYRVFETDDFFYLYIDRTHAFLLNKLTFKNNNPSDFSAFIKKKCWFNFKSNVKK